MTRGSIFLEDAEVLSHTAYPGEQFILRVRAPKCAASAQAGSFAHLRCDPALPMRRPLSIMRADPEKGWVDFLYKIVGEGLARLAQRRPGESLSLLGPIGVPFAPSPDRPRAVLIGGGVGIPPIVFLAEALKARARLPVVFMGSEIPFPFDTRPSKLLLPGVPAAAIAAMPLLEGWGIPSRLASGAGLPGCYEGFVTGLARQWLSTLDETALKEVELFACGPTPMLRATAALAKDLNLPCQVSLEEFMACAVGGCAGCAVEVHTEAGTAMKRVCVDGPVFDSRSVFFE